MKVYTYNDKVLKNAANGKWLKAPPQPTIPDHSLLAKFIAGYEPHSYAPYTATLIDEAENIWLVTNNYGGAFSNITKSDNMADRIVELIEYYDTDSTAASILYVSEANANLKKIGRLFVPNATSVYQMFAGQVNCESGILAAYNYLSSISTINNTAICFSDCGRDTTTGAAELAQIPSSWGGTAST